MNEFIQNNPPEANVEIINEYLNDKNFATFMSDINFGSDDRKRKVKGIADEK